MFCRVHIKYVHFLYRIHFLSEKYLRCVSHHIIVFLVAENEVFRCLDHEKNMKFNLKTSRNLAEDMSDSDRIETKISCFFTIKTKNVAQCMHYST